MTHDEWAIVGLAAGWSALVGVVGLAVVWLLRRRSLRWNTLLVALVAVGGFVSGLLATAHAMFLSSHDFGVVLIVCLVAGAVSLAFSLLVANRIVKHVRALQRSAQHLGEGHPVGADPGGPAELTAVATDLVMASEKLAQSRERERRLDSSRRELIAWVSHDIRTPLAGLRAMAEALEDNMVTDSPRYYAQIRAEVDRMARMVDDLFELSRIHAGALALAIEHVPLMDVIADVLDGADPVARSHAVRLEGSVEDGLVVAADPGKLARAVSNLVMNAIRHTPSDAAVEVRARRRGTAVEITVVDACGGIPAEHLERVFDVAWRGSSARTPDDDSGAGLGLAIVRGIMEAHQGTVSVSNEGNGCRFLLSLPA